VKPGAPSDSVGTPAAFYRGGRARPVPAVFNQERIVARAWPASEGRIAVTELTY
jgi:hypothetical protein